MHRGLQGVVARSLVSAPSERIVVSFDATGRGRVFGHHHVESERRGRIGLLSQRRCHGDTAENDRFDAMLPQFSFRGGIERSLEPIRDKQFIRLLARFCNDFDGLRWGRRAVHVDHKFVHNELAKVVQVDTDPNHWSSFRAEALCQMCGARHHFVECAGLHRKRKKTILEVDNHQSRAAYGVASSMLLSWKMHPLDACCWRREGVTTTPLLLI